MTSDRRCGLLVPMAAAALLAAGCADLDRGSRASGVADAAAPADAGDASGTSFAAMVHPLLVEGCGGCHAAGGEADDTDLVLIGDAGADHTTVLGFVNADQPAESRLLRKGAGFGHGGGAVYPQGSAEYETILRWITQGTMP